MPIPIVPILLLATAAAVAASSTKGSGGGGSKKKIEGIPTTLLNLWRTHHNIPNEKLDTRGEKFSDPFVRCRSYDGLENELVLLPANGKSRMLAVEEHVKSAELKSSPGVETLVSIAKSFEASTVQKISSDLKARQKWWAQKIRQYTEYTGNEYVIALGKAYAWVLERMPPEWNPEYVRAKSIAEDYADGIVNELTSSIGFDIPFPLHALDGEIADLDDLKRRFAFLNQNNKQTLSLPNSAKALLEAWNAAFVSSLDDGDVRRAALVVDRREWGQRYLASDEQVYLVAVVLAKIAKVDPLSFAIELWDRASGWSAWPGLLTNDSFTYVISGDGKAVFQAMPERLGYSWSQPSRLGRWYSTEPNEETGIARGLDCITNARQVQMFDLVFTGMTMLAERGKSQAPSTTKLVKPVMVKPS